MLMSNTHYGYVYKTTNLINGKIYVGQKKGKLKLSYYGSGTLLKRAVAKYGRDKFSCELVCYAYSYDELNSLEAYWISTLDAINSGYNLEEGGKHPKVTEATKLKISKANKGLKRTPERIEEMRRESTGRVHTQETKDKIRSKITGIKRSESTKKLISQTSKGRISRRGKTQTEEAKIKIGLASKGRWLGRTHTEETKELMSRKRKEYWDNKKKLIN